MAPSAVCCAHCGKQKAVMKRCSVCKQVSYCGAECQKAGWKKHKKACVKLEDVWNRVEAAHYALDFREVLKWEGRMEELLVSQSDVTQEFVLMIFSAAHHSGLVSTGNTDHAVSVGRIDVRRVELLGKLQRFRDQGACLCVIADCFIFQENQKEALKYFERARDVGAAHGFFSLECTSCSGTVPAASILGGGFHLKGAPVRCGVQRHRVACL